MLTRTARALAGAIGVASNMAANESPGFSDMARCVSPGARGSKQAGGVGRGKATDWLQNTSSAPAPRPSSERRSSCRP
jgi:hypothetical protein